MSFNKATTTKSILITGGNRGLGKALVERFSWNGNWNVLATARSVDTLPHQVDPDCRFTLDLSQHASVTQCANDILETNIPLHCIVHNAGMNTADRKTTDPEYFQSTFYAKHFSAANVADSIFVNALHPMELTGRIYPTLLVPNGGMVVHISSWLASIGTTKQVRGHYGYCGSKALMNMFMKSLALEFDKETANDPSLERVAVSLNPGWMQTDMGGTDADFRPEHVADQIFAMVDDAEKFLLQHNGSFLNVDGTTHEW